MAVDLKKIVRGKQARAPRVVMYGSEGVGKTRFAAGAPDAFFIDANRGSYDYDVQRVIPDTWDEVQAWVEAVAVGQVKCKTLVLDTLGDIEAMSHKHLFAGSSVAEYEGGWGKGDNLAVAHWRDFLLRLEAVWNRGIAVVLLAHAVVRKFEDPRLPAYDRFELSLRPRLASQVRAWSDFVLFASEETTTQKMGEKHRGVSTGVRYLYTKRTAAYDAKARGVINMPERILLSWSSFAAARDEGAARAAEMRQEIDAMIAELGDESVKKSAEAFLRENPDELPLIRNRLAALLEEKRAKPSTEETSK